MTRFASLEVRLGGETLRLDGFEADFGEPAAGEVVVDYAQGRATVHVLGRREIADGALTCGFGARRAAVRMDLALAARILSEGLARGLKLPQEEARALQAAISSDQQG